MPEVNVSPSLPEQNNAGIVPDQVNNNQLSSGQGALTEQNSLKNDENNINYDGKKSKKPLVVVIILIIIVIIGVILWVKFNKKAGKENNNPNNVNKATSSDMKKRDDQRATDIGTISGLTSAFLQENHRCPGDTSELKLLYVKSVPKDPLTGESYKITTSGDKCVISTKMEDPSSIWLKLDPIPGNSIYENFAK